MWEDHFSKLGTPSESPRFYSDHKEYVENQVQLFCKSLEEMALNVLEDPITSQEVENICKKLKSGKACDFTSLSYEHFKYAGATVQVVLSFLFNKIVQSDVLPDVFKKGITVDWMYRKELFKKQTVRYMIDRFIKAVKGVAMEPFHPVKHYLFEKKKKKLKLK